MAVLLHYLYLVSFMWMLMEGVVLYVVLVKVFVQKSKKKYFILFTVLSYGKTNADCFLTKLYHYQNIGQVSLCCTWA